MPLIFTDRCDIKRRGTAVQGYGSKPKYTALVTEQPFLLVTKSQRGFNSITGEWLNSTSYTGQFPQDADIQEGDQLTNVYLNRNGESELVGGSTAHTFQVDGGVISRRGRMAQMKIVGLKRVN